jgi:hypothetical protein
MEMMLSHGTVKTGVNANVDKFDKWIATKLMPQFSPPANPTVRIDSVIATNGTVLFKPLPNSSFQGYGGGWGCVITVDSQMGLAAVHLMPSRAMYDRVAALGGSVYLRFYNRGDRTNTPSRTRNGVTSTAWAGSWASVLVTMTYCNYDTGEVLEVDGYYGTVVSRGFV